MHKIQGMFKALKKIAREKAEYRASRKLIESLDDDYKFVYSEIEKYIFNTAFDEAAMNILLDTIEAFAIAQADGRSVLSITGDDVSLFCKNLIKKSNIKTWTDVQAEKLNKNIEKYFKSRA